MSGDSCMDAFPYTTSHVKLSHRQQSLIYIFANYMAEHFKETISPFPWAQYHLTWMTPNLRQYLYRIPLPNNQKLFIEGLCSEYGIDAQQNLEVAFKKYTMAAVSDHPLALYKLAELELTEWKQGRRQDRDEEMYLRFRAFAFLDPSQDAKGLEISLEIAKYMRQYDPGRVKLGQLFTRLQSRKDPIDLAYIKAKIGLFAIDHEEVSRAVELLGLLVSKYRHLDAALTLAILHSQMNGIIETNDVRAGEYYRLCQTSKYHKAYTSMGQFLLRLGYKHEALGLFQEAFSAGYYGGLPYILSSKFYELDKARQLSKLISAYIPAVVTGNILCIMNLLHIRCLSKLDPEYYNEEHDLIETELVAVVKQMYELQRLKEVKSKDDFVMAYVLIVSLGYVVKDLDQRDILIDEAFHETQSMWLKRYCLTNLMEVRRRRYTQAPTAQRLEVLKKTGNILANQHLKQLNNNQTASYFYYLAQIYNNGWGVQQSRLYYYLFLCKAAQWAETQVIGNLFLQYYKGNQAKQELSTITELPEIALLCKKIKQDLTENRTCDICYQRTKEIFFHGCQHYCCIMCYNRIIKEKEICHMCRKPVQVVHLIQNALKFE